MGRVRSRVRLGAAAIMGLALVATGSEAGHEMPFYPSYYPQEITVESLEGRLAAGRLASTLHAWLGRDPFHGGAPPKDVRPVEFLGGYLVVTLNRAATGFGDRARRCETIHRLAHEVRGVPGVAIAHPYPVTPYHGDFLVHADLAEAAKREAARPVAATAPGRPVRLVARGPLARKALPGAPETGPWDAALEEIDLAALVASHATATNGWLGPPWLKEGWFHAWLVHGSHVSDAGARRETEELARRITSGGFASPVERVNLERTLVRRLREGCERAVVGLTLRRHYVNDAYSDGVENVGWDSHAGLSSHVFLRTVKLKDFPWNGWLTVGMDAKPSAAWNPVGGFTDPVGRLVWSAVGDPGVFPAPYGADWTANRVTATDVSTGSIAVPPDALRADAGRLVPVGGGQRAAVKLTLKAWASPFHDGTRTTVADLLYPHVFASRWGVARGDAAHDRDVARLTGPAQAWLAGVRVARVETDVWNLGDIKFTYENPVIEVYGRFPLASDLGGAAFAAPWSTVPWSLLVLMEEAVTARLAAFSAEEARRTRLPWLDLARDDRLKERLAALLERFETDAHVPQALRSFVSSTEARQRWSALRRHLAEHGHLVVTNGPYRLAKWSGNSVTLAVVRDYGYPLGVGTFDRYALPLRAWVTAAELRGHRVEIQAQAERATKAGRGHTVDVEAVTGRSATGDKQDVPLCRWVAIDPAGEVRGLGTAPFGNGKFVVELPGALRTAGGRVAVALYAKENGLNPDVRLVSVPAEGR